MKTFVLSIAMKCYLGTDQSWWGTDPEMNPTTCASDVSTCKRSKCHLNLSALLRLSFCSLFQLPYRGNRHPFPVETLIARFRPTICSLYKRRKECPASTRASERWESRTASATENSVTPPNQSPQQCLSFLLQSFPLSSTQTTNIKFERPYKGGQKGRP